MLTSFCGILVPPISREGLVTGFSDAIRKLAESPALRRQLGQAGYRRAKSRFSWESKIDRILELYALAVSAQERPNDNSAADRRVGSV